MSKSNTELTTRYPPLRSTGLSFVSDRPQGLLRSSPEAAAPEQVPLTLLNSDGSFGPGRASIPLQQGEKGARKFCFYKCEPRLSRIRITKLVCLLGGLVSVVGLGLHFH